MRWLFSLLGRRPDPERSSEAAEPAGAPPAGPPPAEAAEIAGDDPRIAEGHRRLQVHWERVGVPDPDVLTYLVNPQFMGAPAWPNTRQAFRVVRTGDSLIIASDGLSDPFVGAPPDGDSGFGMEVFIEISGARDLPFDEIMASPEFGLIEMVARNVAGHGGVRDLLDRHGILSMTLPLDDGFEEGFRDPEGRVGVLVGVHAPGISTRLDLPFGPVRVVAVTPLLADEARTVAVSGGERSRVAALVAAGPSGHRFDAGRASVL